VSTGRQSLRWLINKWFAFDTEADDRSTRARRVQFKSGRCVCVEAKHTGGKVVIFFFRHDDGSWQVFPPAAKRLALSVQS